MMRAAVLGCLLALPCAAAADEPLSAPPGVTFQTVGHETVLGDERGMILYVRKDPTGVCSAACMEGRTPFAAPPDARTIAGWSLASHGQWAYRGDGLFHFTGDTTIGGTAGADGFWRPSALEPSSLTAPGEITVRHSSNAAGEILADASGMTLYVRGAPCGASCGPRWKLLRAGEAAVPLSPWSLMRSADGVRQWAYRGMALYTFAGDRAPDDMRGDGVDGFTLIRLTKDFTPPGVRTAHDPNGQVVLSDNGRTLYLRDLYRKAFDAGPDELTPVPEIGRQIGTAGCDDACTDAWEPFQAPTGAAVGGYWSLVVRPDHSQQWAYKGYPLYTHRDAQAANLEAPAMRTAVGAANFLFWRIARP